jgi:hypothetical protein
MVFTSVGLFLGLGFRVLAQETGSGLVSVLFHMWDLLSVFRFRGWSQFRFFFNLFFS